MELKKRTVFVSGANRGIGRALVEELLKRGVKKIYAGARDVSNIPNFKDKRVMPVTLDITNEQQVEAAAMRAEDIDMLINNAGVLAFESPLNGSMQGIRRDMEVNYYGTLLMMRSFIPVLEGKPDPVLANVVSIAAFVNIPLHGGYCASKAAAFSITQGARTELVSKGIRVHSINPGPIDTDMARGIDMEKTSPEETAKAIVNSIEAEESDIFPDPIGKKMFDIWNNNYRDLEQMVADTVRAV